MAIVHPLLQTSRRALIGAALLACFAAASASAAGTPSIRHSFLMRGQIVEADKSALVICIGSADGAKAGQELEVIHHNRVKTGPKGRGRFERERVGRVRIDAIVDEHYAEATVISGKAGLNDSVELASTEP